MWQPQGLPPALPALHPLPPYPSSSKPFTPPPPTFSVTQRPHPSRPPFHPPHKRPLTLLASLWLTRGSVIVPQGFVMTSFYVNCTADRYDSACCSLLDSGEETDEALRFIEAPCDEHPASVGPVFATGKMACFCHPMPWQKSSILQHSL